MRCAARHARQAGADAGVERPQAAQIGGRVGAVGRRGGGVGGDERVADRADGGLGVARVVPPVRVVARRLGPVALAGQAHRHLRAEVDDGRRAARVRDHGAHPGIEAIAVQEHELRARHRLDVGRPGLVLVRIGVGLQDLVHLRRVARDRARPVADLRRRRDDPGPGMPLRRAPAATGDDEREQSGGAGERRAATHGSPSWPHRSDAANSPPPSTATVGPGGVFSSTESHRPAMPWAAASATDAELPDGQALRPQPHRGRRHDEQRGREQRADRRERGDDRERDEHEQERVGQLRAQAHRARRGRVEAAREPARPEHERRDDGSGAGQAREHEIARARQQQAPEQQRVDVAAGVEDVAREHDAAGQRSDEHERGQAVVARARPAREALDAEREHERRGERAERRREAEAVGQHEAGEGRRADRVGVEREAAHHDPRAEQARRPESSSTSSTPRCTNSS